jgi:site-specific recombinase XerD
MLVSAARSEYEEWLVSSRDLSGHTSKAYRADLEIYEKHFGTGMKVNDITSASVMTFVASQRKSGLSASSVRRRASSIRGFCRWLHRADYLPSDPWDRLALDLPVRRSLPRALPGSELGQLVKHLRSIAELRDGPPQALARPTDTATLLAVTLMVSTGLRVGELVSVKIEDIDLAAGGIRVLGKGRRERVVYIANDWISDLLSRYIAAREAMGTGHQSLLLNQAGRPLSTAAVRARLAQGAVAAGLTRRVTPHMLRHTAATQLVESGVDIRFVQRLLGHASLSTTEIYTHVSDQSLRRVVTAADVLGKAFDRE